MKRKLIKGIKKAGSRVGASEARQEAGNTTDSKKKQRPLNKSPLPKHKAEEVDTEEAHFERKTKDFEEIQVTSSTGKKYKVTVPKSYANTVPRKWKWNAERYRVAELIAMGVPIAQIPDDPQVTIKTRMTIYCWLEHPEFREHVDGLTMETGFANQRERIAGLNRLTNMMFDKVIRELDSVHLTDKSIGAILTGIRDTAKLIAQEKHEFVEQSEVKQQTNLSGTVTTVDVKMEELMKSKSEDERKELEKEFDNVADDIIRSITGD